MTQPYFTVGEEVVLASEDYPEFSGEYIVHEVFSGKPARTNTGN